jgi:Mor family transcriptional regulator
MKKEVVQQIRYEELPAELSLIADCCGLEAVHKLIMNMHGVSFYIPRISRIYKFVERYIEENWNRPSQELAKDLNLSVSHVNRLRKSIMKKRNERKILNIV